MLGKLAPLDAKRDAIHIAVVPVVAGCNLLAGDAVYVDKSLTAHPAGSTNTMGIVDPFLTKSVETGQRFWLFLKPGTVTGMRHHWTHPSFTEGPEDEKAVSVAWLKRAASECGVDYETMMDRVASGGYIHMGENESYKTLDCSEFEKHVKVVTGKEGAYPPFSCSC